MKPEEDAEPIFLFEVCLNTDYECLFLVNHLQGHLKDVEEDAAQKKERKILTRRKKRGNKSRKVRRANQKHLFESLKRALPGVTVKSLLSRRKSPD